MSIARELAYRVDPAAWVNEVIGITPTPWQQTFLRAPRGSSLAVLTARQCGKTTTAAWAMAHAALYRPASLSVVACPAQRQSAEAVRKVRDAIDKGGGSFKSDNVYGLELTNGARVLALPGSDDSIRGLTVDAFIIADEAAQLNEDMMAALRPMRARRPDACFAMLSTAWSRTDPFWTVWEGGDPSWIRIKATADQPDVPFDPAFLAQERRNLGELAFAREYLGIPTGSHVSPFGWDLYDAAVHPRAPKVPPGPAFGLPPVSPAVLLPNPFRNFNL